MVVVGAQAVVQAGEIGVKAESVAVVVVHLTGAVKRLAALWDVVWAELAPYLSVEVQLAPEAEQEEYTVQRSAEKPLVDACGQLMLKGSVDHRLVAAE